MIARNTRRHPTILTSCTADKLEHFSCEPEVLAIIAMIQVKGGISKQHRLNPVLRIELGQIESAVFVH